MFKIKATKKSTTTIASLNEVGSIAEKKTQLYQNNDFINVQDKLLNEEIPSKHQQMTSTNPPTLLKNGSLRPRSGINRNPGRTSTLKYQPSDQQKIQQKIRQKKLMKTNLERPSTSTNLNEGSGIRYEKKQRLVNRKGTLNNMVSTSNNNFNKVHNSQNQLFQEESSSEENGENGYISNQKALEMILEILDKEEEYTRLKMVNECQFQKIRQKLISNISIIVLKWYKCMQDQLYNQVKNITSRKQNGNKETPSTVEQLIRQQIKKQFSKQNGLFTVQQRCNNQQSRLEWLIDSRLQKLEHILSVSGGNR